jgi:DNA-binding FrmR family transcriptional regulator
MGKSPGAVRRGGVPLPILQEAFVPDERKAELKGWLKRIQGQAAGLERMLDDNRPCLEILTQVSATQEAIRGFGRLMVRSYVERGASAAIKAGREKEVYDELLDVIFKLTR